VQQYDQRYNTCHLCMRCMRHPTRANFLSPVLICCKAAHLPEAAKPVQPYSRPTNLASPAIGRCQALAEWNLPAALPQPTRRHQESIQHACCMCPVAAQLCCCQQAEWGCLSTNDCRRSNTYARLHHWCATERVLAAFGIGSTPGHPHDTVTWYSHMAAWVDHTLRHGLAWQQKMCYDCMVHTHTAHCD
jgi:hypothetical protein